MKYVKLFEQFDENDPFGEETKPRVYNELEIIEYDGIYLLMEGFSNGYIRIFNNFETGLMKSELGECRFYKKNEIYENIVIRLYKYGYLSVGKSFSECKYKDLPQEIKDRIV